jgi:FtsP/CotA-like multicopper oxidase with cupredoxin domain
MMMQWVPTRPGNWLFHCHLIDHIDGTLRFFTKPDEHGSHAEQEMAGLVMGIQVRPASNVAQAAEPMARRKLRLFVNERANVYRSRPGYSYVLQDGATEPARDSLLLPSSTLVLHRNEPTEITVINHSHAMASIHWHGIELESFYDGVSGWSGWGSRTAPVIVPGDSFVVRMTPDRAGTFIYHTHSDETEQLASGLYGALFVVDDKVPMDTTQRVFLLGSGGPQSDAPDFVNGSATPPSVDIRAGTPHRFRLINISTTDAKIIRLMGDSAVQWRAVAKDGAELPARQAAVRPATVTMLPGETYDFDVRRPKPESMRLEIVNGSFPTRPPMKIPVNVH